MLAFQATTLAFYVVMVIALAHGVHSQCISYLGLFICSGMSFTAVPSNIPLTTRHLRLNHNNITAVRGGQFANLDRLKVIVLDNNPLRMIDKDAFQPLEALEVLHMQRTLLTSLPPGVFANNHVLARIVLVSCRFTSVPVGVFDSLPSVATIDLRSNPITTIPTNSFKSLPNLDHLKLQSCAISSIEPEAFVDLPGIETMDISGNRLTDLPVDMFDNLTSLVVLGLSHNPFLDLEPDLLSSLSDVQYLDMSYIGIASLTTPLLANLTTLRRLILSGNNITALPPDLLSTLSNLRRLDLQYNELADLPASLFSNMGANASLEEVYLQNNNLTVLPLSLFSNSRKLKYVQLNGNALSKDNHLCSIFSPGLAFKVNRDVQTFIDGVGLSSALCADSCQSWPHRPLCPRTAICEGTVAIPVCLAPALITYPHSTHRFYVLVNTNVSLTFKARGRPAPTMDVFFDGVRIPTQTRTSNAAALAHEEFAEVHGTFPQSSVVLNLPAAMLNTTGEHVIAVHVTNVIYGLAHTANHYRLDVGTMPILSLDDSRTKLGVTTTLRCSAQSTPALRYFVWQYANGSNVIAEGRFSVNTTAADYDARARLFQTSTTLTITDVQPSDLVLYVCVASNGVSMPTKTGASGNGDRVLAVANLTLDTRGIYSTALLTRIPEKKTYHYNELVVLTCTATGKPTPQINWYANFGVNDTDTNGNDTEIINGTSYTVDTARGQVRSELRIEQVKFTDAGLYWCSVSNEVAVEVSHTLDMDVLASPQNTYISPSVKIQSNDAQNVTLSCAFSGVPAPRLAWYDQTGAELVNMSWADVATSAPRDDDASGLEIVESTLTLTPTAANVSSLQQIYGLQRQQVYACVASNDVSSSTAQIGDDLLLGVLSSFSATATVSITISEDLTPSTLHTALDTLASSLDSLLSTLDSISRQVSGLWQR